MFMMMTMMTVIKIMMMIMMIMMMVMMMIMMMMIIIMIMMSMIMMIFSLACDGLPNCGENQIPNPDEACFKVGRHHHYHCFKVGPLWFSIMERC